MSEQLDRFIDLMKGIFEIDKSDLDFGIYRIMNIRKREIETFLTEGLPKRVQETLAPFADNSDAIREEMAALKKKCDDLGMEIENVPKLYVQFTALQKKLAQGTDWQAPKYSANNYGTQLVNRMFKKQPFSYPKSLYTVIDCIEASLNKKNKGIVLDYFAGSGTTAQAINTLNLSKISLKYILVEMGSYFYTATLPRVKKSCYQIEEKNWLDGKPLTRDTGIPQIIKYMRLESYEDALSNIEFNSEETGLLSLFGDDYLIRYMLDLETEGSLLNVAAFSNPFDYKMKITEKNESRLRNVDLCETFNYLIGLSVIRQSSVTYFKTVKDVDGEYDGAVKLVPDRSGKFAFMQIEGTLPNGDRALVIWRIVTPDTVESNAALDAYFLKHRINPQDREYDVIFVNGDNNLENLRTDKEIWKVVMTETEFKRRMFEETE